MIELWFDGMEGIDRLLSIPSYLQYVRPDEAAFNDLAHNIMLLTQATTVFRAPSIGRCKRFDFIRRSKGADADAFAVKVKDQARALALDPLYTGQIDRHVENFPVASKDGGGFGEGDSTRARGLGVKFRRPVGNSTPGGRRIRRHQKLFHRLCD